MGIGRPRELECHSHRGGDKNQLMSGKSEMKYARINLQAGVDDGSLGCPSDCLVV